jgi:hypothetical protein
MHTPRIRCNYCDRRIPANLVVCPNCQRNPRAFYWRRWHVVVLVLLLAVCALGYFAYSGGADFGNMLGSFVALANTATPPARTATPTRPPVTVVIVATRPPNTATRVPPTATRRPNTATPIPPTAPPSSTITPTRAPRTPAATETPTTVPTPIPVTPPTLLAPADGERIIGSNKRVMLAFHPAEDLSSLVWHRVQVDFLDRAGNPISWCGFTKEASIQFPREFFDDSSPSIRSFLWRVNVVRSNQENPTTCDAPYEVLSAPSQVWTFYWY